MEHTGRLEPETVTAELSLVLQVRAWMLEQAIPLPVYSRLTLAPEVMDRTEDALGEVTADALFLARELGVPLFSDDLGLNLMAEKEWQVRPTDTLQHLQELHARKHLSFAAYVEQLSSLSRWHYSFIGVSANVLTQAFRDEPEGADFPQLTSELASPRANKTSALEVGADTVLALLDVRDVDYRSCLRAVRTVLDVLAERTDARDVALHMVRRVLLRRLDEPASQSIYLEMFRVILWKWVSERGLLDEPA